MVQMHKGIWEKMDFGKKWHNKKLDRNRIM